MSIFSRLFQKEDGDGDDTPPDGIGAVEGASIGDGVSASGAAAEPEGLMNSSEKTAPIKIVDDEDVQSALVAPPSLPMPAGSALKVPPPLPRRASHPRREKTMLTPAPLPTAEGAITDHAIDEALNTLFPTGSGAARPVRAVAVRAGVST